MSRRSLRRRGLIRKGVIKQCESSSQHSTSEIKPELQSSFNLFRTSIIQQIQKGQLDSSTNFELAEKAVTIWKELSLKEQRYWHKLADDHNKQYFAKHSIVSYHENPEKDSTEIMSDSTSLPCIEEGDELGMSTTGSSDCSTDSQHSTKNPPCDVGGVNLKERVVFMSKDYTEKVDNEKIDFVHLSLIGLSCTGGL